MLKQYCLRTLGTGAYTKLDYPNIDVWISSESTPENPHEIMARALARAYKTII